MAAKIQPVIDEKCSRIKRAVIYARVSSDDRSKEDRNLESQLKMGREYAAKHGYKIVMELPEDDRGASGAAFDLPQLGTILAMADQHEFDVLIVREIDRLSRNLAKQLIVEERLKHCGVSIEYVLGEYPDTPEGNLQKNVKGSIAEYEREKIRERTMRGRHNIARSGKVVTHGRPLYGYRLSDDGKLKGLVIFEPEARIVRLVFLWYIAGDETGKRLSMQAIANKLSEMNVPTWADTHKGVKKTRMAGQWSRTAVQAILKNEAYAGRWIYAKDSDDPVGVTIPAIIDDETWQAAQCQRRDNVIQSKRNTKHDYLMRTRLTCSCGYCVSAHAITPHGTTYFYYRCSSVVQDYADKACHNTAYFSADDVDKLVWDWLKEWLKDPDDLRRKLEAYQSEIERSNAPVLALINVNEGLIANYVEQLERAKTMFQIGVIGQDELIERKLRLENTIAKLENERDTFQNRMARGLTSAQVEGVIQFARKLSKGIDVADKSFVARRWIIDTLDVRGIISIEDGDKLVDASVIFDDQPHGKRLVLPKRGRKLSVADKSSPTPG